MKRRVVIPIDDILRLLQDYAGEALNLPEDVKPVKLMFNATQRGKIGLLVEAESWTGNRPAEEVKFDMRRVYGL